MSTDFSLSSLGPIAPLDLSSAEGKGVPEQVRIEKVSKAMEAIFVSQLTSEMGQGIGGPSATDDEGGDYSDFIQQAMTQGVTQGGGLGLAKVIENYLTHRNQTVVHHDLELKPNTRTYHVNHVD